MANSEFLCRVSIFLTELTQIRQWLSFIHVTSNMDLAEYLKHPEQKVKRGAINFNAYVRGPTESVH